jgi:hypothetical protein
VSKIVTKVTIPVKPFRKEKSNGTPSRWAEVLADVKADIAHLEKLVPIIERKIEKGEPWPTTSATQN